MSELFSTLLLAGGKSSRMDCNNKALIEFNGKPMIEHLISELPEEHGKLIISSNRQKEQFEAYSQHIIDDTLFPEIAPFSGPLLGILSAMNIEQEKPFLVLPCDTPNITRQHIDKLLKEHFQHNESLTCAVIQGKIQPLHSLVNPTLKADLYNYLKNGGRRAQEWFLSHSPHLVDFSDDESAFKNMNYRTDLI